MLQYLILFDDFDDFCVSSDAPRLDFRHSRDDEMRSLPLFDDLCTFFDSSGDDEMLQYPLLFDDFDNFCTSGDALQLNSCDFFVIFEMMKCYDI